jgi:superfamily I DNA/RNA helicase
MAAQGKWPNRTRSVSVKPADFITSCLEHASPPRGRPQRACAFLTILCPKGDTTDLWGGTFHSMGHRFLRRHAILDREDAKGLVKACVPEALIKTDS